MENIFTLTAICDKCGAHGPAIRIAVLPYEEDSKSFDDEYESIGWIIGNRIAICPECRDVKSS